MPKMQDQVAGSLSDVGVRCLRSNPPLSGCSSMSTTVLDWNRPRVRQGLMESNVYVVEEVKLLTVAVLGT